MKTSIAIFAASYLLLLFIVPTDTSAQTHFRSGLFFHHSTGECIWGPNGSSTSVPQEMTRYNTQHGYTGTNAVTMNELWFPVNYDNDWYLWHTILENGTPESIASYLAGNKIIMIKSCFPSSAIEEIGQPIDTVTPDYKTVYNYKWHWRHIITFMKNHPQNFFVIWTNAPLTQEETTPNSAYLSRQFCKWAKDTLAAGHDPVYGAFPSNVYVFDFFSKLTNASGYLLPQYAVGAHDPHPNASATALVAPLLVDEVFDHSIGYEGLYGIKKISEIVPSQYLLEQNYPNPFNPSTKIKFDITADSKWQKADVNISVYDILGNEIAVIVNKQLGPGTYEVEFDASNFTSGIYFYRLKSGKYTDTKKMILMK